MTDYKEDKDSAGELVFAPSLYWVVCDSEGVVFHLHVCAERPADGAVVVALQVTQQVAVRLIRQVHHILVIQERAQFRVWGHVLEEQRKVSACWESDSFLAAASHNALLLILTVWQINWSLICLAPLATTAILTQREVEKYQANHLFKLYIYISAGKRLIASKINVFIYIIYVHVLCIFFMYIYKWKHMYTFKKNIICLYIKYIIHYIFFLWISLFCIF